MKTTPFTGRLNYPGKLDAIIERLCRAYGFGVPTTFSIVEVGYEDCNVAIQTAEGKFLAKMFNKKRTSEDVERYVSILEKAVERGVNHPELLRTEAGATVYREDGLALVLMRFIEGKTFFELERAPDSVELEARSE